jgi:hypothetical protein
LASAAGLLVSVGAFDFARQGTSQLPGLAKCRLVELRAWGGLAFLIDEQILQAKVEAAAFTRAGFGQHDFLDDPQAKPQPAHAIALDSQRFDAAAERAMLHKFVFRAIHDDAIVVHLVARRREGERCIVLRLLELRTALGHLVQKARLGSIDPPTDRLTTWRVQLFPQRKAVEQPLQHGLSHVVVRDGLARQPIVAALPSEEGVPTRGRHKELVSQPTIFLVAALQAVFVHPADFATIAPAVARLSPQGGWELWFRDPHLESTAHGSSNLILRLISPAIIAGVLRRFR